MKIKMSDYITARWGRCPLSIGAEINGTCWVCSKDMKRTHIYKPAGDLEELEIRDAHKSCDRLAKRREKLKQKLSYVEYEIFCRTLP